MPRAHTSDPEGPGNTPVEWRVRPHGQRPRRIGLLAGIIVAASLLAYAAFGHWLPALLTAAALLLSVSDYLLPITCRLTGAGAARRNGLARSEIAWADVRRWWTDGEGVKLSPLPEPSRLEAFRGVYLPLPDGEEDRARVLQVVSERCRNAEHVGWGC